MWVRRPRHHLCNVFTNASLCQVRWLSQLLGSKQGKPATRTCIVFSMWSRWSVSNVVAFTSCIIYINLGHTALCTVNQVSQNCLTQAIANTNKKMGHRTPSVIQLNHPIMASTTNFLSMFSPKAHCCALTLEVKSDLNLDLHKFEMNYILWQSGCCKVA